MLTDEQISDDILHYQISKLKYYQIYGRYPQRPFQTFKEMFGYSLSFNVETNEWKINGKRYVNLPTEFNY